MEGAQSEAWEPRAPEQSHRLAARGGGGKRRKGPQDPARPRLC